MAELRDEILFRQPESSHLRDCPICFLPLPLDLSKSRMMAWRGKVICHGCDFTNSNQLKKLLLSLLLCADEHEIERSSWTNVLLHYHKHLSHEILVQLYHKQNSIMFATNLVASWGNYDVIWGIFYVRLRRALHTKRQQPYVTCHWDPKWLLVHEYTNIIISSNKKIKRASIIPQHHLGDDVSTQWREAGLLNHSNWIMFVYNNKPCSSKVEQATLLYHLL
jgi:hypothetical protein